MTPKQQFKVEMIIECRPNLLQFLLEELCATAEYENARIHTYSSELINNEQKETGCS